MCRPLTSAYWPSTAAGLLQSVVVIDGLLSVSSRIVPRLDGARLRADWRSGRTMSGPWDRPGRTPRDTPGALLPAMRHAPDRLFPVLRSMRARLRRAHGRQAGRGRGAGRAAEARADDADLAAASGAVAATGSTPLRGRQGVV